MKVLVFDISGEFAHYRKYNTTTSPLTYPVPPRTAVAGLLGAVTGMDRFSYYEPFSKKKASIAVQLLNPVDKVYMAFNLVDTKKSFFNISTRTQIEFELLKNPAFRIFLGLQDELLYGEIRERIYKRAHYFTPYLGLSQFTADVSYVDETDCQYTRNDGLFVEMASVLNLDACDSTNPVEFDYNSRYSSFTVPNELSSERIVQEYATLILETKGGPIRANPLEYFKTGRFGNIQFL